MTKKYMLIPVFEETWKKIRNMKEPHETFQDVIQKLLIFYESDKKCQ